MRNQLKSLLFFFFANPVYFQCANLTKNQVSIFRHIGRALHAQGQWGFTIVKIQHFCCFITLLSSLKSNKRGLDEFSQTPRVKLKIRCGRNVFFLSLQYNCAICSATFEKSKLGALQIHFKQSYDLCFFSKAITPISST